MKLTRQQFRDDGIFSQLKDDGGNIVANTLEHSYNELPKLPNGTYTCVRGSHRLHGMTQDFQTFEVTGVPGHTGILFHVGNFNSDSDGCLLLGEAIAQSSKGQMITNSKATFYEFMASLVGVDEFELVVE